ncbi:MAG TPA: amidohydrolase [Steroidobacteraceae bacterium]|nr:amidohydrolase [Steroidobacteraceae bacterium]
MFNFKRPLAALLGVAWACAVPVAFAAGSLPVPVSKVDAQVQSLLPGLETLYQEIHEHPEIAFHETRTAALLAHQMQRLGFKVTEGVGGTGLVAMYENGPGPTVLVRTELDALPMTEATGLTYASQDPTADHSCGHDLHMAIWVGTAAALLEFKSAWHGRLMFIGQPAEETVSGAKAMLADGLYTRFGKPDYALALHVRNSAAGHLFLKSGTWTSAADSVQITFKGRGAHGSMPSESIDPVVMAAHFVTDVQTIISREKNAAQFGVITVGSFHAGTAANIIPDTAVLQLTLRSYDSKVRALLLEGVKRTAAATAAMASAPAPAIVVTASAAAVENDPALTARTADLFQRVFGSDVEVAPPESEPISASEDFSEFGSAGVPSMDYTLGAYDPKVLAEDQAKGIPVPVNHSPLFAPAMEPTISAGVKAMSYAVMNLLQRH